MSGLADTIRRALGRVPLTEDGSHADVNAGLTALDALVDTLAFYADPVSYENATPRHVRPVIRDQGALARAALAGEAERIEAQG